MQSTIILIVASLIYVSIALPVGPIDSSENDEGIDDYEVENLGCRVVNGSQLFFDDIFLRNLTSNEQKEAEKFDKAWEELLEKVRDNDDCNSVNDGNSFNVSIDIPDQLSFCKDLEKFYLSGCFELGGKIYKENKEIRNLTKKEKNALEEYKKKFDEYYDALFNSNEDVDLDKLLSKQPEQPKSPILCN